MQEYYTPRQLVELGLYTSVKALYAAIHNRKCPPYFKIHKRILFSKHEVEAWLSQYNITPKDEGEIDG